MFFVEEEGTASSFARVLEVIAQKGLFSSLYTWNTPEAGGKVDKANLTQFGRALRQLGIEQIPAYSHQARGRSERMFGTHQGRLPREPSLYGITDIEAANRYLRDVYMPSFNTEFARPAREPGSAFVPYAGIVIINFYGIQTMTATQTRLDEMVTVLKAKAFRLTPQRIAVLKILAKSEDHPTVDQIYEDVRATFPTTSLATVYKTVTLLKQLGQVLEIGFGDSGSRYDGRKPYPHPHLICLECNKILDPKLASIGQMTAQLTRDTGFQIVNHRLDFFGICPDCRLKKSA